MIICSEFLEDIDNMLSESQELKFCSQEGLISEVDKLISEVKDLNFSIQEEISSERRQEEGSTLLNGLNIEGIPYRKPQWQDDHEIVVMKSLPVSGTIAEGASLEPWNKKKLLLLVVGSAASIGIAVLLRAKSFAK